jgi:hypothetical protein
MGDQSERPHNERIHPIPADQNHGFDMNLSKTEKSNVALKLKARVTELFDLETQNSKTDLSYLGVCKITEIIEQEFVEKTGAFPKLIDGACCLARALRNPDKMKAQEDLRKGFALLVVTAGGLSITWGVLSMLSLWSAFWVFVFGMHISIFGPLAIAAGLIAAVGGVYSVISTRSPQELSAKAHDILIQAISSWADEKEAAARDEAAKKQLLQCYSRAGNETAKDSMFWKTVTWPYRTVTDFVDEKPKKTDQT